ncbi:MAG: hypothetical protein RL157_896, partial [Bacteroidota bacterium]
EALKRFTSGAQKKVSFSRLEATSGWAASQKNTLLVPHFGAPPTTKLG